MLNIISKSKIWYAISGTLFVTSIVVLAVWRLNFGIDFTGGTLLSIEFSGDTTCYPDAVASADRFEAAAPDAQECPDGSRPAKSTRRPDAQQILQALNALQLGDVALQTSDVRGINLRFKEVDEARHRQIITSLTQAFPDAQERRFETIGGVIGKELRTRSLWALGFVLLFILLYLAWSFRHVSRPVPSWQYGIAAIIALFHDVIITLGIFAVLGHYNHSIEIAAPFIAAILTVLAYSVSDTIVVFDRTRENLLKMRGATFVEVVNTSINQTMRRSIMTSCTILLSLLAIFFFGGTSIKYFALTLIIGIMVGTYSSIFIASPLLITWRNAAGPR
ncbi:MAG: protein translocase subunit SecF [bacterium]|nr:protein translocase subunit SecF [bacterium]